ncbi:GGDEF domain-containing protein [Fulvimarina sp. MAC8]|uniref:GGDEF domain-containing protein n=1 Tax=Fulvimarina sp. MAC8 TaxID=3162874 RepID=UPI0032EBD2E7
MPVQPPLLRSIISECLILFGSTAILSAVSVSAFFDDFPAAAFMRVVVFAVVLSLVVGAVHIGHILVRTSILETQRQDWKNRAMRDRLTGLLNRQGFKSAWGEKMLTMRDDPRTGMMLLILDADHFKRINDRFGHPIGDHALKAIARTTAGSLRANDICGRLGGEEFVVAVHGITQQQGHAIAERIRSRVSRLTIGSNGKQARLTVSIGGAFSTSSTSFEALYKTADENCYKSKNGGRNRVTYTTVVSGEKLGHFRDYQPAARLPATV